MKAKARKFFDSRGLKTDSLINKNRYGLQRRQIEHGMKKVFRRIQSGEEIKDIMIAREVWEEARKHRSKHEIDLELEYEENKIVQLAEKCQLFENLMMVFALIAVALAGYIYFNIGF